jgi:phosphatidylserine decarboxylase
VFAPGAGRLLIPSGFALGASVVLIVVLPPGLARLVVTLLLVPALAVTGFLAWFFRDPERRPGPDIVSAADGRVVSVGERDGRWQVAVFMNVTDVHVNRFPLDASVDRLEDGGAGFRPAYAPDASHNVRRHYHLVTQVGPVEVVQMTGIAARRLVALVRPGETHRKGDRLGMIVLGSRVDVFLPAARTQLLAQLGQRVRAGVTPIARVLP